MSNIRRRLEALEGLTNPHEFPDWPFEDQMEELGQRIRSYWRFHKSWENRQAVTDREIRLLGLLFSLNELPGGVGEYRFPSGVVVSWTDNGDDTHTAGASGYIRFEDLPETVRAYVYKMDPAEQPKRDQRLYDERHFTKKDCARTCWHEEHGWDKRTPAHLWYWETQGEGGS